MFCILEKDLKTYAYFRRYVACFENRDSCLEVDNHIQAEELAEHIHRNSLHHEDTPAKLHWISCHGKAFREYLNTIKLVYVLCKANGKDPAALSESEFAQLEDAINQQRYCLQSIYS